MGGIDYKLNTTIGKDLSVDQLRKDFDAVFLGMGLTGVNSLLVDGEDSNGIDDAVRYIEDIRQAKDPVSYTHLTLPTICSV